MANMKKEDLELLERLHIDHEQVCDGSGLTSRECRDYMNESGFRYAYNVSPCSKAGHTLRTKSWNCLHCTSAPKAFAERYRSDGYIYIACSDDLNLIKIGTCSNLKLRLNSLRNQGYGEAYDWEMIKWIHVSKDSGQIEHFVQAELKPYYVRTSYFKEGRTQSTYEIFDCSVERAWDLLKKYRENS